MRTTAASLNSECIDSVAICVGSGAAVFKQLGESAALLITGEMSHHDILYFMKQRNSHIILTEHSNSERGYLEKVMKSRLHDELTRSSVLFGKILISEMDRDPLRLVVANQSAQ